jgi:hypothetical protein
MSSKIVSPAVPPHGPTAGVISQPCDFVTSEPLLSLAGVQSHES